jgi:peptide/nickel transport system substrate-binding protein
MVMNMLCNKPPFDDVRVRQAFRLIADREQLVALALDGYGRIANDVNAPYEPDYPRNLPQRQPDIEQAKSLLKAAGQEGLKLAFVTAPMDEGVLEAAQVFSQQALKAGVTLTIRNLDEATFWDKIEPNDMKVTLDNEYWNSRPYLDQTGLSIGTAAGPRNVPQWSDPKWDKLVAEAIRTVDETKRNELVGEAQTIEYYTGPHIVYGFKDAIDGYSTRVVGLRGNKDGYPLNHFQFNLLSFA